MLEPNGPLPPEIYWRRRLLAIAALVVVLALVIWLIVALLGGGDDEKKPDAAAAGAASTTPAAPAPAAPSTTVAPTTGASTTPAPAGDSSGTCSDQSLALKVSVDRPTYPVGGQPVFGLEITNISPSTCQLDIGSKRQEVVVQSLDGQHRLWSNTDCAEAAPADQRPLAGGEKASFQLTWSGTTSQPACAGERTQVPQGSYAVLAQLGSVHSAPETFNIA